MQHMMAGFAPPSVSVVKAEVQEWQPQLQAVGTLRAVNGADLSSEAAGIVDSLNFESGSDVEKDAVLVHLRDADDVAKLHALEATEKLAEQARTYSARAEGEAAEKDDAVVIDFVGRSVSGKSSGPP